VVSFPSSKSPQNRIRCPDTYSWKPQLLSYDFLLMFIGCSSECLLLSSAVPHGWSPQLEFPMEETPVRLSDLPELEVSLHSRNRGKSIMWAHTARISKSQKVWLRSVGGWFQSRGFEGGENRAINKYVHLHIYVWLLVNTKMSINNRDKYICV